MRRLLTFSLILLGGLSSLQAAEEIHLPQNAQDIIEKADTAIAQIREDANEDMAKVYSKSIKSLERLQKKLERKEPASATLVAQKITELKKVINTLSRPKTLIKNGASIAFFGDSITQYGWKDKGYVKRVIAGLEANGISITAHPAGVSGNTSDHLLKRLNKDVLSKNPEWMTLSCGINDVAGNLLLDQYIINITSIVDQAQAAGIKVILFTATIYGEDLAGGNNNKLASYNAFLRELAKERNLPIADLNADMHAFISAANKPTEKLLTVDGIHMNDAGNILMAKGVLRTFRLDNKMIAKAEAAWQE